MCLASVLQVLMVNLMWVWIILRPTTGEVLPASTSRTLPKSLFPSSFFTFRDLTLLWLFHVGSYEKMSPSWLFLFSNSGFWIHKEFYLFLPRLFIFSDDRIFLLYRVSSVNKIAVLHLSKEYRNLEYLSKWRLLNVRRDLACLNWGSTVYVGIFHRSQLHAKCVEIYRFFFFYVSCPSKSLSISALLNSLSFVARNTFCFLS